MNPELPPSTLPPEEPQDQINVGMENRLYAVDKAKQVLKIAAVIIIIGLVILVLYRFSSHYIHIIINHFIPTS